MRAVTFQGVEQIAVENVPDPIIRKTHDAIVEVRQAGVCGSDLHVYHGRETGLDIGTVLGHEFVGEIVEVGSAIENLRVGDLVVSPFTTNCGTCMFCTRGLTSRCVDGQLFGWVENGEGLHGAQAERVRVPLADSTLVPVPTGIPPEAALLAGDVLATGYYCAVQGEVGPGKTVAVLGCGPVGLMAVFAALHLGAESVLALDSVDERLDLAQRLGATVVDIEGRSPAQVIAENSEGLGFEVVLEAVGSAAASRLAFDLVVPGGTISAVGVHTEPRFPFSPTEAYDKNLTYRIGRCPARHFLPQVLAILSESRFDPTLIISHRLPLTDGVRAYRMFADRSDGCTKVVLAI
jgi:2-desacetyl-2-hydroxyethyl bacteriochlorophyllide A dehydrogenase